MGNCLSLLLLSDVGGTKIKKLTLWQPTPSRKTCWSVNANIEQLRLPRKRCRISMQNASCLRLQQMRRYIAICFPEPLLKDLSSKLKKRIKICIW